MQSFQYLKNQTIFRNSFLQQIFTKHPQCFDTVIGIRDISTKKNNSPSGMRQMNKLHSTLKGDKY